MVSLTGARLAFGDRVLWDHLDLSVSPGEFIAVLAAVLVNRFIRQKASSTQAWIERASWG